MNVLYVDHATALGGAEHSLLALLRTLDRAQVAPTLACPPGRLADRAREADIPVVDLKLERVRDRNPLRSLWRLRRGCGRLRSLLADGGFEVVHANTLRATAYASKVARRAGVGLVWHVRDYDIPAVVRAALLRSCDLAVAPSRFIAQSLGGGSKVRLVPNGIDPTTVPGEEAAEAFRADLGIAADAVVVGCLGRIRPWKGQHYFIEVAARLAERLPAARFVVVGDTLFPDPGRDYRGELEAEAMRLGLSDRVVFAGHREDPLAALLAMDVVANCSENEPFGRVLIEAMACRRPVVAFRSGAVPEIVVDGSTGLLVPPGDSAGMAEGIAALVHNGTLAESFGEAGRARVAARFTLAASTAGMEAVYREFQERS